MLDQITWGTPGSLLCLGFFFCGVRNFLKKYYVIYKKQIKHQKGIYLIKILNKRILPFTEGFFCLVVSF
ncbi:hypothetical protein [Bacillus cereus]|uniref:hypothetical protein n=1 Tax=Bacillus cereus TaxID=1396 RepID=UPI001482D7BE|nr:hypothetical protein [Bacillus cereus]